MNNEYGLKVGKVVWFVFLALVAIGLNVASEGVLLNEAANLINSVL